MTWSKTPRKECLECGSIFYRAPREGWAEWFGRQMCSKACVWSRRAARLWSDVSRPEGREACWLWPHVRDKDGYGKVRFNGRDERAHRAAWIRAFGPIPVGQHVLHRCDNPPCTRASHLFLGDNAMNSADRVAKGRSARGEAQGLSKLHNEDVLYIRAAKDTHVAMAERFGVCTKSIQRLKRGLTWGHVK